MAKYQDIAFNENGGYWDLSIDSVGDFTKTDSFDTAILLSAIGSNRRASETEVPIAQYREGWIGDINQPVEYGSKLWLLYQERLTLQTMNAARTYLDQATQWFVDFSYCMKVVTTISRDTTTNTLSAKVQLIRFQDIVTSRNFTLWENTGGT
jgi:phage gp46-like protein